VLGRLERIKNIGWLINVFAQTVKDCPDMMLIIVGRGSQKKVLQNIVARFELNDKIKFEDWVDDPSDYLSTADAVLFPSLSEGYGLVPIEAHSLGTPVIMTDVGVANYELKPAKDVRIVPLNHGEAFASEILKICGQS